MVACPSPPVMRSRIYFERSQGHEAIFQFGKIYAEKTESFQRNNEPFADVFHCSTTPVFLLLLLLLLASIRLSASSPEFKTIGQLFVICVAIRQSLVPVRFTLTFRPCTVHARYGQTCCNVMQSTVVLNCLPIFFHLLYAHCVRINSWIVEGKLREKTTTIFISFYVTTEIGTRCETTHGIVRLHHGPGIYRWHACDLVGCKDKNAIKSHARCSDRPPHIPRTNCVRSACGWQLLEPHDFSFEYFHFYFLRIVDPFYECRGDFIFSNLLEIRYCFYDG